MKKSDKWLKVKSKKVHENFRFSVFEDDVIFPDGSWGKFFLRKTSASVVIIPFDGKRIFLVNQYRYAVKQRLWELPIGKAENNNYLAQAKKELKEETGITSKKWQYLGGLFASPGGSNERPKIFLARSLEFGEHGREASESDMFMEGFSLREIDSMISTGKIVDGWTISALHIFKLKFKKFA